MSQAGNELRSTLFMKLDAAFGNAGNIVDNSRPVIRRLAHTFSTVAGVTGAVAVAYTLSRFPNLLEATQQVGSAMKLLAPALTYGVPTVLTGAFSAAGGYLVAASAINRFAPNAPQPQ